MAVISGILIFTVVIIHISATTPESRITVTTNVGKFTGVTRTVSSLVNNETRTVSRFLGIPYAEPPIGDLRFSKPVPYGTVKMEYNATYFRPHCIQTNSRYIYLRGNNFVQSEDCLYLNIYKPEQSVFTGKRLPVMVYVHGGGFGVGGADIYDGDKLSAFHDVIVVVINYRLNIFGFLSDGSKMTGNYGLWDIKLALHWISCNIAAFEGDNRAVTIFGNSAGGAAVFFQATQPSNKGLFQRVISQSGTILALWSNRRNPEEKFKEIVDRLNCERHSISETMQCLRAVPADDIKTDLWYTYLPTIDGNFIKDSPLTLLNTTTKSGKAAVAFLSGLDLIVGSTNQDGALQLRYWNFILNIAGYNTYSIYLPMEQVATTVATKMLGRTCGDFQEGDAEEIIKLYSLDVETNDTDVLLGKIIDMETDIEMFVPSVLIANLFRSNAVQQFHPVNIYLYIFSQKPDFAPFPKLLTGATHFMEVPYVFGLPTSFHSKLTLDFGAIYPENISHRDIMLSETMMTLWSNFAQHGNPNDGAGIENLTKWPRYEEKTNAYLDIAYTTKVRSLNDHPATSRVDRISKLLRNIDKICTLNSASRATSILSGFTLTLFSVVIF